jgi:hypothetical protein
MININNEKEREELIRSINSKDGKKVMDYMWQLWRSDCNYEDIDLTEDNSKVGEAFKASMAVKKFLKHIESLEN